MHKNYELISKTEKDILDIENGNGWASEDAMQAKDYPVLYATKKVGISCA